MKRIFLKMIFALAVLVALSCVEASACWCRNDPEETDTDEHFSKTVSRLAGSSDFVFSGTLVEENDEKLIFQIENSWKGNIGNKITFIFHHNVTENKEREYFIDSCAYSFEFGKSYLVYAFISPGGQLEVSKCGRTDVLNKAGRDIEELNRLSRKEISGIFDFDLFPLFSKLK